jgi:hypothetical protein
VRARPAVRRRNRSDARADILLYRHSQLRAAVPACDNVPRGLADGVVALNQQIQQERVEYENVISEIRVNVFLEKRFLVRRACCLRAARPPAG